MYEYTVQYRLRKIYLAYTHNIKKVNDQIRTVLRLFTIGRQFFLIEENTNSKYISIWCQLCLQITDSVVPIKGTHFGSEI